MSESSSPLPLFRHEPLRWRASAHGLPIGQGRWVASTATCALVLLAAVALLWVLQAPLPRTLTLQGRIISGAGSIELFPAQRSTIAVVHAQAGASVNSGDPLLTLERRHSIDAQSDTADLLSDQTTAQLRLLETEASASLEAHATQLLRLQARETQLRAELEGFEGSAAVLERRIALHRERVSKIAVAVARKALPAFALLESEDQLLALEREAIETIANVRSHAAEISALHGSRAQQKIELEAMLHQLERSRIDLLRRSLLERQAMTEVLRAPRSGTVEFLSADVGATVSDNAPVVVLRPAESDAFARLWVPAQVAVEEIEDRPVLLLVDAYPFHRHGALTGVVRSVQLVNATDAHAGFRADVAIDAASARFPVRDGYTVTADILLEDRTLWDAIRAPFLRVRRPD